MAHNHASHSHMLVIQYGSNVNKASTKINSQTMLL